MRSLRDAPARYLIRHLNPVDLLNVHFRIYFKLYLWNLRTCDSVLEVADNELGDGGAKQIGQMLKSNSTLMHLDLTSARVTAIQVSVKAGSEHCKILVDKIGASWLVHRARNRCRT